MKCTGSDSVWCLYDWTWRNTSSDEKAWKICEQSTARYFQLVNEEQLDLGKTG
jgi:hypothetical protein